MFLKIQLAALVMVSTALAQVQTGSRGVSQMAKAFGRKTGPHSVKFTMAMRSQGVMFPVSVKVSRNKHGDTSFALSLKQQRRIGKEAKARLNIQNTDGPYPGQRDLWLEYFKPAGGSKGPKQPWHWCGSSGEMRSVKRVPKKWQPVLQKLLDSMTASWGFIWPDGTTTGENGKKGSPSHTRDFSVTWKGKQTTFLQLSPKDRVKWLDLHPRVWTMSKDGALKMSRRTLKAKRKWNIPVAPEDTVVTQVTKQLPNGRKLDLVKYGDGRVNYTLLNREGEFMVKGGVREPGARKTTMDQWDLDMIGMNARAFRRLLDKSGF